MLRKMYCAGLIAAALPATVPAFAQYGAPAPYYSSPQPPNSQRGERAIFDQARADLDRAAAYPWSSRADRKRFDEARRDLFDFESRFDQGRYERHELDEAISRLARVVSHNSLDPRDRGALAEDLRRMRDYRDFRGRVRPY